GIFSLPDGNILIESTLFPIVTFYLRQFGMTVCDYRHLRSANPLVDLEHEATMHYRGEKPNCAVGVELDVVAFFSLLYETIKSY
ncbi:MAG: hypothetical protein AAGU75_18075, partial [Bacillota bacterium]